MLFAINKAVTETSVQHTVGECLARVHGFKVLTFEEWASAPGGDAEGRTLVVCDCAEELAVVELSGSLTVECIGPPQGWGRGELPEGELRPGVVRMFADGADELRGKIADVVGWEEGASGETALEEFADYLGRIGRCGAWGQRVEPRETLRGDWIIANYLQRVTAVENEAAG